jgi:hypothetical protein
MTPDELSADREGRLLSDLDEATKEKAPFVVVYASDLRALLKAYQEQRRALERARLFVNACAVEGELTPNETAENPCEVVIAIDAALNQKGDER